MRTFNSMPLPVFAAAGVAKGGKSEAKGVPPEDTGNPLDKDDGELLTKGNEPEGDSEDGEDDDDTEIIGDRGLAVYSAPEGLDPGFDLDALLKPPAARAKWGFNELAVNKFVLVPPEQAKQAQVTVSAMNAKSRKEHEKNPAKPLRLWGQRKITAIGRKVDPTAPKDTLEVWRLQ